MIGVISVTGVANAQTSVIGYDKDGNFYISGTEEAGPGNYILEPEAGPTPPRFRQVVSPAPQRTDPAAAPTDDQGIHYDTSGRRLYGTGHALPPNSPNR
jgi:hypothetical protein